VRARIVEKAARALRRDGLAALSIPALMKQAGLTHGGFYGYFQSREQLVAEAVHWGAQQMAARVFAAKQPGDILAAADAYLSLAHAKHPEIGCVIAALGTEGRQQPTAVRRAFSSAARELLGLVDGQLRSPNDPSSEPSDDALRIAAQLVGAVVLARLLDEPALSKRVLEAARSVRPAH